MTDPSIDSIDVDLKRGNRVWNQDQIYVVGGAGGRVVPNPNDMVYKYEGKQVIFKRVTEVDYTTYSSTLVILGVWDLPEDEDVRDIILLGAPGRASSSRRLYVDRGVKPITASVDVRLWIAGNGSRNIKLFRGTNTQADGEVVSCMYDQSGTLMGEDIPLQVVATVDVPNEGSALVNGASIKVVSVGNLTRELNDNELVTMVVYNDQGGVVFIQELLVYNTTFSRRTDMSRKYVIDVEIDTDFVSEQDSRLIQIPRNTTLESVLLFLKVIYSDRSTKRFPIDGQRALLHGLNSQRYIANRDGLKTTVMATYRLDENEFLYGAAMGEYPHKTVKYIIETTPFEEVFSCRLWALPMWEGDLIGYRMKYFLTTLRRDSLIDVTNLVRVSPLSPMFEPKLYGVRQQMTLTLQMNEVLPIFQEWKFVQPLDIVLYGPGHEPGTNWTVNYQPGQATVYGLDNKARGDYITAGNWRLDISQGEPTHEAWLNRMYRNTLPIHNPTLETVAPNPTHIKVTIPGGQTSEFTIGEVIGLLPVLGQPSPGTTVQVEFINRTGNGDQCLGIIGIPFTQVD